NLKKCLSDEPLEIPLDELHIDDKLRFVEEPLEIIDREIKWLRQSCILIVKVRWNSKRGPEFTWEREDQFKQKYPHLFINRASSSTTRDFLGWLFEGMLVPQQAADVANVAVDDVVAEDAAKPTPPLPTPTTTPPPPQELPSTSQVKASGLKRLKKVGTAQRIESSADTVMNDQEDASKQEGIIADLDADKDVILEEVAAKVPKDADV
nr:putative reverse transcriptase domain-containing protein [Tanacetum cinerariifolium]